MELKWYSTDLFTSNDNHMQTLKMKKTSVVGMALCALVSIWSVRSFAQQDPMFTQYMFNTLSINPAYAGSKDFLSATVIHRSQWVNFEGAPVTQSVTIHSPLRNESISLGGSVINDAFGPVKQTGIYLDGSYRIFMGNRRLSFGLKGGVNLFSATLLDINPLVEGDASFDSNIANRPLPNFGAGVMYYTRKWYVGASVPKLLSNKLVSGELPDYAGVNNKETPHAFLIAGAVFDVNIYTKFKPTILVKAVNGAPPAAEATAQFLFYDKFWAGAMYRWQDAAGSLLQYEINRLFKVGYAFDYSLSDIRKYSDGSHEIMLGFDLNRGKSGDVSPRYF
jgi:type IX secretion system PorP/SprF family membrane protein